MGEGEILVRWCFVATGDEFVGVSRAIDPKVPGSNPGLSDLLLVVNIIEHVTNCFK